MAEREGLVRTLRFDKPGRSAGAGRRSEAEAPRRGEAARQTNLSLPANRRVKEPAKAGFLVWRRGEGLVRTLRFDKPGRSAGAGRRSEAEAPRRGEAARQTNLSLLPTDELKNPRKRVF